MINSRHIRRLNICCIVLLVGYLYLCTITYAQSIDVNNTNVNAVESSWKGFKRHDFTLADYPVRVIIPAKPAPGNPWLWRARFPDWHNQADSILVREGFHLVYINTNNMFGSPRAMMAWDSLYTVVTDVYKLNKKVALAGVSKGGLFIYNWAKKNPEKVNCIYAEAPVCDFKSWPAGFGTSEGSPNDWQALKKEYGFESDEEANRYTDNPIDNLEELARQKVPLLHMIGLDDKVVPPEENTFPLVNKYIRLGGAATVVPCTIGMHQLNGHHFDIETPRIVADFIKYHSLQNLLLQSTAYHALRGGLQNSQIQFERNGIGKVAFLGGSITYNGGWRDSIYIDLKTRFPNATFEFIPAGIPSMGSTPGAFRLERDVLSHGKIDLIFIEAAVNDATNGTPREEQIKATEGIIRHLRRSNPAIDIVMMHFVDPDKIRNYQQGKVPDVIQNHERVAQHYSIPTINLAQEVAERIAHKEFTWEGDFKNLHPSPFGQQVYYHSMKQLLDTAWPGHAAADDKIAAHEMPKVLENHNYDQGVLVDSYHADFGKNWTLVENWKPTDGKGTRENYVNVPMLISESPGKALTFRFIGNAVGIAVAAGPDAGMIEYRIDKGQWKKSDLYTRWSSNLHLPWYYTLASDLPEEKHTLQIKVIKDKNSQSTGNACRIHYFYVNE